MKALIKKEKGIGHLALENVDIPSYGDTEVLIKVKAVGICGSDLHILHDAVPYTPPVIIGHEFSGEIVAAGKMSKTSMLGSALLQKTSKVAVAPVNSAVLDMNASVQIEMRKASTAMAAWQTMWFVMNLASITYQITSLLKKAQ